MMKLAFEGVWGISQEKNVSLRMAAYMIAIQRVTQAQKLRGI
jgi:glutamate dehydrogenase (NAD(P)+)